MPSNDWHLFIPFCLVVKSLSPRTRGKRQPIKSIKPIRRIKNTSPLGERRQPEGGGPSGHRVSRRCPLKAATGQGEITQPLGHARQRAAQRTQPKGGFSLPPADFLKGKEATVCCLFGPSSPVNKPHYSKCRNQNHNPYSIHLSASPRL